ncbi:hypothetical protein CCMA1212_008922 [Trichoderma ghanense]|uniref:Uncharacterized protein n=1 Tax=Trichoderma ghanense TaxID=65468 RepID=A0ABY2GUH9_9HYPO
MPLGNFATILPFLSPSSPPILNLSRAPVSPSPHAPVPPLSRQKEKKEEEEEKEKRPTLRICFPLKVQRGASSWWEYEEFRIQFRDGVMWRQAFGLDGHDTRDSTSSVSSSSCYSDFEGGSGKLKVLPGANGTFYNDADSDADDEEEEEGEEDRGMKSRWSFSSSSTSSVDTKKTDARASFVSGAVSAASSNRLMHLIPRLLSLTRADDNSTTERLSYTGHASAIKVGFEQKKQQQLRPAPLKLEPKRHVLVEGADDKAASRRPPPTPLFSTSSSSAAIPAPASEEAQIKHHRNITLQKLEGSYIYKPKKRYLSTFRSLFRTPKSPSPKTATLPTFPDVAPLRIHSPPGTFRISSQEWAKLRDGIVGGLSADAEALFPFFTGDQRAAFMRVEQKEGKFKVERGEGVAAGGVKEVLERIGGRNREDVLFVEFEDTPRMMRWWYTTREPLVFEWGASMI